MQFSSISFDAATFEIWGSLLNGARLVLFPTQLSSLEELGRVIKQKYHNSLVDCGIISSNGREPYGRLTISTIFIGWRRRTFGSTCKKVLNAFPGIRVINGYGPTENTTLQLVM